MGDLVAFDIDAHTLIRFCPFTSTDSDLLPQNPDLAGTRVRNSLHKGQVGASVEIARDGVRHWQGHLSLSRR